MPFQALLGGEIWSLALRTISGSSNHTAMDESAGTRIHGTREFRSLFGDRSTLSVKKTGRDK